MHGHGSRGHDPSDGRRGGRRRTLVATTLACFVLGACGGGVKESDRDTSGRFDGRWVGSVEEGVQSSVISGTWKKSCTSGDWRVRFDVEDGTISVPLQDVAAADRQTAYVDANGSFRLVVPRPQREVSSRQSGFVGKSSVRWIFDGRLIEGDSAVKFTIGDSHYGGNGCRWNLDVERV